MTVDSAGRSAAAALRGATAEDLEVRAMLDHLQRDSRRHKGIELAALVGAAALIVGIGWMFLRPANDATAVPGGTVFGGDALAINFDTCASDADPFCPVTAGRYLLPLEVPFTASVPAGWDASGVNTFTDRGRVGVVAEFRNDTDGWAHVGFEMNPRKYVRGADDPISITPSTAQDLAFWVASKPYLAPTEAVSTTVGGLPAWQVDVQLKDGVKTGWEDRCKRMCIPMIGYPDTLNYLGLVENEGPFRWIFVQAPDGKVVNITIDGRGVDFKTLLDRTQPIIDGLVFDSRS